MRYRLYATPLEIHTRTATAHIVPEKDLHFNCQLLAWLVPLNPLLHGVKFLKPSGDQFMHLERNYNNPICFKVTKRGFGHGNQCAIKMKILDCNLNMKVFEHGSLQITGARKVEAGTQGCEMVLAVLRDISKQTRLWKQLSEEWLPGTKCNELLICDVKPEDLGFDSFKVCGFNGTFRLYEGSTTENKLQINQSILNSLLVRKYELFSQYEPCAAAYSYTGIKTRIYWNHNKDGKCCCMALDDSKRIARGSKKNGCVCDALTIMTFRTGSISFLGGYVPDVVLNEVYNFYINIIRECLDTIHLKSCVEGLYSYKKYIFRDTKGNIVRIRTKRKPIK